MANSLTVERTSDGPKFLVGCTDDGDGRSFEFTAADATNGRSFAPVAPLEKIDAYHACEEGVRARTNHPSSVDMSLMGVDYRSDNDGRVELRTTFKAKNSFNLTVRFDVACYFNGPALSEIMVSEAR